MATFDFGPNANKLMRFAKNGKLAAVRDFGGTPMLGLGFDPVHGKVYILNMGASKVQRIAANFDGLTPVEDVAAVPGIGAPGDRTSGNPDGSSDTTIIRIERLPRAQRNGVRPQRQPLFFGFVSRRHFPY